MRPRMLITSTLVESQRLLPRNGVTVDFQNIARFAYGFKHAERIQVLETKAGATCGDCKSLMVLHGVALPVCADADFVTPDFEELFLFYPRYRLLAVPSPFAFQAYMLWICAELERRNARPGRTRDEWMRIIICQFGYARLWEWVEKYR